MALTALFAAYFFVSREYGKQLWLLLALCPVMLEISQARAAGPAQRGGPATRLASPASTRAQALPGLRR